MIPEFEEDLFHLECSWESFDQDGSPDSVVGDTEIRLREEEDVVPETGFKVVFHLWKVKVGTGAALDELVSIVIKIEGEIEERGGQRSVVDCHTGLVQMPTPRSVGVVNQRRVGEIESWHTGPKELQDSRRVCMVFRRTQSRPVV